MVVKRERPTPGTVTVDAVTGPWLGLVRFYVASRARGAKKSSGWISVIAAPGDPELEVEVEENAPGPLDPTERILARA